MQVPLRVLTAAVVAFALFAPCADAQLGEYQNWADGPEGLLLTKKEAKAWEDVKTEAEAEHFVELFWARRDPNLDTPMNEFRSEFAARTAYADENFATEDLRGALTERGKVLLLLGTPYRVQSTGPSDTVVRMAPVTGTTTDGGDGVREGVEVWEYDPAKLSPELKVRGSQLIFSFYLEKVGTKRYVLDRSNQYTAIALRALSRAPDVYLLHPELDQVPRPVSVPGGSPATSAQLALLSSTGTWDDRALFRAEPGVADAIHRPLWVHLELPADAPVLDTLSGRVEQTEGGVVSTFQVPANPLPTRTGKAYHLTFPLLGGSYLVEIAGVSGGEVVAVKGWTGDITEGPAEGTWLSPVWTGVTVSQDQDAPLGAAFNFGGWHLIPSSGGPVTLADELSYFGYAVRPGLGDDGKPSLSASISLYRDGKRLGSPLRVSLPAAPLTEDLFLFASSITLSGLREPGSYRLAFKVKDDVTDAESQSEVELEISQ
jgi:GWxTD domain-containing protein